MTPFVSRADLQAALPEVLLTVAALLVLTLDFFFPRGRRAWVGALSLFGVLVPSWAVLWQIRTGVNRTAFSGLYVADPFSLFFKGVFLLATALIILMAMGYLPLEGIDLGEFYVLLLFSTLGMMLMASASDLLTVYIGLETMSVCIYALIGFLKRDRRSVEAALKYLLMGIFASGVLLYGFVLFYGLSGTTELKGIARTVASQPLKSPLLLGLVLISAGFGFKIAAVPFHMYVPDAYEGAPHPVTAFISIGPKVAGFAVLLRVFLTAFPALQESWTVLLAALSFLTMTVGNIVAIAQRNVKRMLAYSSIAHVGYMLIGVVVKDQIGVSAVLFYGLAYCLMNLGAFAVVILLCQGTVKGDQIEDFTGLARRSPAAAFAMLLFLLSLAGVPPTAGFVGKLYLFGAAINAGQAAHRPLFIGLAIAAVVNSAISLYYYMRVAMYMYMRDSEGAIPLSPSLPLRLAILLAVLGTLLIGLYPGLFLDLARASVEGVL